METYIQIEKDGLKTTIVESDFVSNGYKDAGWKPVEDDWTKNRTVKTKLDVTEHLAVTKMREGAHEKK
jgi:hypothetical protein